MHIFQGVTVEQSTEGWPMGFTTGKSVVDNEIYAIGTIPMSGTDVPQGCSDAKDFAELAAGLLNAYYSGYDVTGLDEQQVMKMGQPLEKNDIPHPANTEISFNKPPF